MKISSLFFFIMTASLFAAAPRTLSVRIQEEQVLYCVAELSKAGSQIINYRTLVGVP